MPVYPALYAKSPDISVGNALVRAEQIKGLQSTNALNTAKMQALNAQTARDAEARTLSGSIIANRMGGQGGGYQEGMAMAKLAEVDPDAFGKMQTTIQSMDEAQRKDQKAKSELGGQLAQGVLSAPPVQQPELYQRALQVAQSRGLDTTGLPAQWGPDAMRELKLRRVLSQSMKEMIDHQDKMEQRNFEGPPLTQVYDPTSPTLSRNVPRAEAVGKPGAIKSGITVTTDENGRPVVQIGGTPGGLQKSTRGKLESSLTDVTTGLSKLAEITSAFKPEYQTIATRWGALTTAFAEKVKGIPVAQWLAGTNRITPEEKKTLADFSEYKRTAFNALNDYIKSVTGAAMSEAEARRIMKGMPNPGEGLFDGDSPTEYESKLRGTIASLRRSAARYSYALKNGLDWRKITLDQINDIMKQHADRYLKEVPEGVGNDQAREIVKDKLRAEFGI